MGKIIVDALDVGVLGGDHGERGPDAAPDVDERVDAVEPVVELEELLGDYDGVVLHALIEHLVEPRVRAVVLERRHAVGLVEWDPPLQHRILQVVPNIYIHYKKHKLHERNIDLRPQFGLRPNGSMIDRTPQTVVES